MTTQRRVAAICDIHGNLPALDAVLADIRQADVDRIVVAGDVVPGPMPRETLERLTSLDRPVDFLYGNGDRAVLAQMDAADPHDVTYWGGASGAPLPEPLQEMLRWSARQLGPEHQRLFASWPKTVKLAIDGLGHVLFCHATPRNEVEIFTRQTSDERLGPAFAGVDAAVVVCGHTHMQFDRTLGALRVVNAGSVGMPFGTPGAHWLLLGPDVQLRRSEYDLAGAAEQLRRTTYPDVEKMAIAYLLSPPSEETMLAAFANAELS